MRYRNQRNYGCRVHDEYTYKGMPVVVLENELLRISVLAGKGTEIYEYVYKPLDLDLMWLSANGVQNPHDYLQTSPDPISTFIDYYPGGWQEIFPNGGPTSSYAGAQFGQHGEVAHMPWDYRIVTDTPEEIAVEFTVRLNKMPFRLTKTLTLRSGEADLHLEEEAENTSPVELPVMWGQHLAYGKPFLDESCEIVMPPGVRIIPGANIDGNKGQRIRSSDSAEGYEWPLARDQSGNPVDLSKLPPAATPGDVVYLTGFSEGRYEIVSRAKGVRFEVRWDAVRFPYVWYWQEYGATEGYPWYGRHYNIGLEPFSSYPTNGLSEAVANGSAMRIRGGGKVQYAMSTAVRPL